MATSAFDSPHDGVVIYDVDAMSDGTRPTKTLPNPATGPPSAISIIRTAWRHADVINQDLLAFIRS